MARRVLLLLRPLLLMGRARVACTVEMGRGLLTLVMGASMVMEWIRAKEECRLWLATAGRSHGQRSGPAQPGLRVLPLPTSQSLRVPSCMVRGKEQNHPAAELPSHPNKPALLPS